MAKIETGVLDNRTGKFHPASTPNPTRTARGSIGKADTGHVNSAVATAQAHALHTGRPATVATRVTGDDGSVKIIPHGKVSPAMRGTKSDPAGGNQLGKSTSNGSV